MRQLLGIDLSVLRPRLVEKDEYQGIARLGHCIAALAHYLSGHAACIIRNDLTEAIALDGNLLSGFDLGECPENGGMTPREVRSVGSIAGWGNANAMGVAVACDRR